MGEPPFSGYAMRPMDTLEIGLYLAPSHPLASAGDPLPAQELARYRAVTIQDSSRQLPPRTINLAEGQETMAVASLEAKIQFMLAGLGVGYLPQCVARPYVEKGLLLAKGLDTLPCPQNFYIAWHAEDPGLGLKWWIEQLGQPGQISRIWSSIRI
jgi:DNA-binding transcriptional LysR family regulator